MNQSNIIGLTSALLQLGMASYAWRFAARFGKKRLGWSLFGGLSLLAVCNLLLSANPAREHVEWAAQLNFTFVLFALLLLTGVVYLEKTLRTYRRKSHGENRGSNFSKVSDEWPRAYEQLREITSEFQEESAEYKRHTTELASTNGRLTATNEQLTATNQDLTTANQGLTVTNQQLTATNQQLTAAHDRLTATNQQLTTANDRLAATNQQLTTANDRLTTANEQLTLPAAQPAVVSEPIILRNEPSTAASEQLILTSERLTAANQQLTAANQQLTRINEELTRSHEELGQRASALEKELFEKEIVAQNETPAPTPTPTPSALEALPDISIQIPLAEEPARPLPKIDVLLNSLNASVSFMAEHLAQSGTANTNLSRIAKLMRDHTRNLGGFMTSDPRGKQVPSSLSKLTRQLADEQSLLVKKVDAIKKKLKQINTAVTPARNYDDVPRFLADERAEQEPLIHGDCALQFAQTDTATDNTAVNVTELDQEVETQSFEAVEEAASSANEAEEANVLYDSRTDTLIYQPR